MAKETLSYNHAYSHGLPVTVARLFTVYGPWGRPDMAVFKFTKSFIDGQPIDVYGLGKMTRDFTYVAGVVEALRRLMARPPNNPDGTRSGPTIPYRVVNVGCSHPIGLEAFIETIEAEVGRPALTGRPALSRMLPMQPCDVPATWADTTRLEQLTEFRPVTQVAEGIHAFVDWYRRDYSVP